METHPSKIRAAAVNWAIRPIRSSDEFYSHAVELLDRCADEGVEFAVFPECFTLELLALAPVYESRDVPGLIPPEVLDPIFDASLQRRISLVAGSTFFPVSNGFENCSRVVWNDGREANQSKIAMTQFELEDWKVQGGRHVSPLPDPRFGVSVCYDVEFPENGRSQSESGVLCLAVPAFTETEHGFWRVRHTCHARAVENQIFVIHASLVGSLGREPVPSAVGSSAILAPCVSPFPASGVLAESPRDVEGIAVAELDFDVLLESRNHSDVRNWHDRQVSTWPRAE